jgi:VWFA-related protein
MSEVLSHMRRAQLALCSILILAAVAYGQAAKTGSPKPAGTFSTTSRNVVMDVIVTDGNGNPIHGLKAHDFTILENGTPQHVKGFEEHRPDEPSSKSPVAVSLPADTYTNYVTSTEPGAVNIILFDSLNTDRLLLPSARQQLISYLAKLPDNARVALFTLDGELHLLHGFTDDNHALIEASQQLSTTPGSAQRKARDVTEELAVARFTKITSSPQMYGALSRFLWSEYDAKAQSRTLVTMEALNELARSVAIFQGRKNLIWISGGIPFDPTDTAPQMQKTAALLAATQIAVYPIDVRGIPWLGADGAAYSQDVFGPRGGDYSDRSGQGEELSQVHETMLDIAHLTGGRAYFNNNDMPSQIQDIVQTGSSYYTLAYRPDNQEWNGKFRKVSVKASQPNAKVRTRPGYYAVKDPFGSPDVDRTFSLAMQPGVPPSTSLVMQARVLPPDTPNKATQIDFLVDVHDLQFLMSADHRRQPNLMFVAAAWDEQGKAQGSVVGNYQQILQPADVQVLLHTGLRLQHQLALKPGNYQLRLGLVDRLSGKMGTIDVPLKVGPS